MDRKSAVGCAWEAGENARRKLLPLRRDPETGLWRKVISGERREV